LRRSKCHVTSYCRSQNFAKTKKSSSHKIQHLCKVKPSHPMTLKPLYKKPSHSHSETISSARGQLVVCPQRSDRKSQACQHSKYLQLEYTMHHAPGPPSTISKYTLHPYYLRSPSSQVWYWYCFGYLLYNILLFVSFLRVYIQEPRHRC
jgi:hypothetical protein